MAPSDAQRKKIEKEIKALDKTSQEKSAKVTSQREELERLKSELLNYGSDRLAAVKNRMDAMDKKIKQVSRTASLHFILGCVLLVIRHA
ncbi:unnamed protein product [Trichobilharzia regenti]|nr:unnamed protein product [Trichobilharzia regenti]